MNNVTHLKHEHGVDYFESADIPFKKHLRENDIPLYYKAKGLFMLPVDKLIFQNRDFRTVRFEHFGSFIIITGFSQ